MNFNNTLPVILSLIPLVFGAVWKLSNGKSTTHKSMGLIAIGVVWMTIHAVLLITVAKLIRAPYFFLAVGSQANVGAAASAPIVAAAFHPSLASVGVLLAVLGYAIGTIAAIGCTILMELAAATA